MVLDLLDCLSAKLLTFGGNGYVGYAKINTKNRIDMDLLRCFALDLDIDVILRSFLAERGTGGLRSSESISLIVS